ncbi:DUF4878 domain-containing protein [Neobacillus drentensis]|uniref:DUF4878 domain-containing protein n=1 Tax=Neobacillus drentensis TaxID=220684 RepID=UPI002FFFC8F4
MASCFKVDRSPWHAGTYPELITKVQKEMKSIKPIDEKITGETAIFKVKLNYKDGFSKTGEIKMIKDDGIWKIAN